MGEGLDWTDSLRIVTAVSFIPAFPLCLVHGIVSHKVVPAIGLVPLAISAVVGLFIVSRGKIPEDKFTHPALVFFLDAILATGMMIVLVFTWVIGPRDLGARKSMFAAYATFPLIENFLIHFFFCLRALYFCLGINHFVEWLAWQAAPAECPNCHHQLRPPRPTWRWRSDPKGEYSPLFVDDGQDNQYDDEGEPSHSAQPPQEVTEVIRKNRKGKDSTPTEEHGPWAV